MKHAISVRWLANSISVHSHFPHDFRSLWISYSSSKLIFFLNKWSCRSPPIMLTIESKMENGFWTQSSMPVKHIFMVSILWSYMHWHILNLEDWEIWYREKIISITTSGLNIRVVHHSEVTLSWSHVLQQITTLGFCDGSKFALWFWLFKVFKDF